jgi:hypothetical protein
LALLIKLLVYLIIFVCQMQKQPSPSMVKFYLLILIGIFGCTRDRSSDIAKLKFPDPDRDCIKENQIDTTYTFHPQENGEVEKEYTTYDRNGNVLVHGTRYSAVYNKYDNNGLLITREIRQYGTFVDSITYEFDSDSIILKQTWSNSKKEFKFYFDEKGWLLKSEELGSYIINYTYEGNLLKKVHILTPGNRSYIESYFYYSSKGILDSAASRTDTGHTQSWNYDSVGLLESDENDKYIHIKRKGVH